MPRSEDESPRICLEVTNLPEGYGRMCLVYDFDPGYFVNFPRAEVVKTVMRLAQCHLDWVGRDPSGLKLAGLPPDWGGTDGTIRLPD